MVDVDRSQRWDVATDAAARRRRRARRGGAARAAPAPRAGRGPGARGGPLARRARRRGRRRDPRRGDVPTAWFGDVAEHVLPVIGDVVVAMTGRATVVDSRTQTPASLDLVGVHGSLTRHEMLVLPCAGRWPDGRAGLLLRDHGQRQVDAGAPDAPQPRGTRARRRAVHAARPRRRGDDLLPARADAAGARGRRLDGLLVGRHLPPHARSTRSTTSSATRRSSTPPDQVEQLARVVDELGVDVFAFGISTDFRARLFPGAARLVELADRVEMLQVRALCWCGARATHNARTIGGTHGRRGRAGRRRRRRGRCRRGRLRGPVPSAPHAPHDRRHGPGVLAEPADADLRRRSCSV